MRVYIYALICPITTTIKYIGQTVNTPAQRRNAHLSEFRRHKRKGELYTHKHHWLAQVDKLNLLDEIKAETLEVCDSLNGNEKEKYWIQKYSHLGLANILPGGASYDSARVNKIREAKLGEKNPMFGKTLTEDHKRKMVEGAKKYREKHGSRLSDSAKEKISKSQSTPVTVLNDKFETLFLFASVKECAAHFGYTPENIQRAISQYRPIGRWSKQIMWVVKSQDHEGCVEKIKANEKNEFVLKYGKYPNQNSNPPNR